MSIFYIEDCKVFHANKKKRLKTYYSEKCGRGIQYVLLHDMYYTSCQI